MAMLPLGVDTGAKENDPTDAEDGAAADDDAEAGVRGS